MKCECEHFEMLQEQRERGKFLLRVLRMRNAPKLMGNKSDILKSSMFRFPVCTLYVLLEGKSIFLWTCYHKLCQQQLTSRKCKFNLCRTFSSYSHLKCFYSLEFGSFIFHSVVTNILKLQCGRLLWFSFFSFQMKIGSYLIWLFLEYNFFL